MKQSAWQREQNVMELVDRFILIAILVAALVFVVLFTAYAGSDEWTTTDTALEVTYQVLHRIDWKQTLVIASRPSEFYEKDAASDIGCHPTKRQVNRYMAYSAIGHLAMSYVLRKPWRTGFQMITIVDLEPTLRRNKRLGINISYGF